MTTPSGTSPNTVARLAFAALLAFTTWHVLRSDQPYLPLISDIDLAIHEFGHVLWSPFGETLSILGGSLTQGLFPVVFVAYFLRARDGHRDVYAALACAWWAGLNLVDVAAYINDARAGELMLLNGMTGRESDAHDWNNLLARWDALAQDRAIAATVRRVAALILVGSVAGMLWLTYARAHPTAYRSQRNPSGVP